MSYGVCMCTIGPPAGGVCRACGAVGPPLYPYHVPPVIQPGTVKIIPSPGPSEGDIRRIVREELEREKDKP